MDLSLSLEILKASCYVKRKYQKSPEKQCRTSTSIDSKTSAGLNRSFCFNSCQTVSDANANAFGGSRPQIP